MSLGKTFSIQIIMTVNLSKFLEVLFPLYGPLPTQIEDLWSSRSIPNAKRVRMCGRSNGDGDVGGPLAEPCDQMMKVASLSQQLNRTTL